MLLAFLAVRIVSRRRLLRLFQVPGLILLPLVFLFPATNNLAVLRWGIFFVGLVTIGQFSFWGNYLPRVYPTYLRGTGESFAANVGGRMIGTSAALLTTQLVSSMPGASLPTRLAYASALVGTVAYVIAVVASMWLPEPSREDDWPIAPVERCPGQVSDRYNLFALRLRHAALAHGWPCDGGWRINFCTRQFDVSAA